MIRFNRLVLLLRIIFALSLLNIIGYNLINYAHFDFSEFTPHYLSAIFTIFLFFTLLRMTHLIFKESFDVEITDNGILTKNIITKKQKHIHKNHISGFQREKYYWNLLKISGIQSFWELEANQIVIISKYRVVLHLKSLNYYGIKKITESLIEKNYNQFVKRRRYFDRERYRFI